MAVLMTPLGALGRDDAGRVGAKAAHLGELMRAGFAVPDGLVIHADALGRDLDQALDAAVRLGTVAVRSSAVAEDLPETSCAGLYESVLGVSGAEAIADAIRRCWRSRLAGGTATAMAVVVQKLVEAEAAGVAFTAHPVSGDRGQVVVAAVRGLGDRLLSGAEAGEEWLVATKPVLHRRAPEPVLDEKLAQEVAATARRVEAHFGVPQDVEWAVAGRTVYVLQARPITALPEAVRWPAPRRGGWLRNFRLGEWLPEPVTPLFETWFIERCEAKFAEAYGPRTGFVPPAPLHVLVNGWYFHSPLGSGDSRLLLRGFLRQPRFNHAFVRAQANPERAEAVIAGPHARAFSVDILPRYRSCVERASRLASNADSRALAAAVDEIADLAGDYLWSFSMVGGFAWKVESALATFCRRHLAAQLPDGHQALLVGLAPREPLAAHAVQSLDWFRPTVGELGGESAPPVDDSRFFLGLAARREALEAACRGALGPEARPRFDSILAIAQRYSVLREEQARHFTLGWPIIRRAVIRIGETLVSRGALGVADDVFFLKRAELAAALGGAPAPDVSERRRTWQRQRRLSPPLMVGRLPLPLRRMMGGAVEAIRSGPLGGELLRGMPASPGRATGPVRVVGALADADRLRPADVLVTRTLTPAWIPVLRRAAAVVTDGGTIVAHAALLARELGVPAVVGAGQAVALLREGHRVTVDGSRGVVESA
jgi:rifampicin phosphotransferase